MHSTIQRNTVRIKLKYIFKSFVLGYIPEKKRCPQLGVWLLSSSKRCPTSSLWGFWRESFFHLPTVTIRNGVITGGNCCNISVLVQNDGEDEKTEKYMMFESKTDQLLASLKPTASPHVYIELVRRGGDRRGVSLCAFNGY